MCGIRTNIVGSVEVIRTKAGDGPFCTPFIYITAPNST